MGCRDIKYSLARMTKTSNTPQGCGHCASTWVALEQLYFEGWKMNRPFYLYYQCHRHRYGDSYVQSSLKWWTCGVVSILTWQLSHSHWTPCSVASGSSWELGCGCVCVSRLFINDWVHCHCNSISLPDHGFGDTKPSQISILSNKSCKASSIRSSERLIGYIWSRSGHPGET